MPRWPRDRKAEQTVKRLERAGSKLDADALRDSLATRWREAREGLGLSQRQLAEALGHKQSWCADVEAGRQLPSHRVLAVVSTVSGRSLAWLYGLEA